MAANPAHARVGPRARANVRASKSRCIPQSALQWRVHLGLAPFVLSCPMWLLLAASMPQAVAGGVTRLPMTVLHVKPAMPRSSDVIAQYGGYGGQPILIFKS